MKTTPQYKIYHQTGYRQHCTLKSHLLEPVDDFTYLSCNITYNNSNMAAMHNNLGKAMRRWGVISKVMMKMGETVQASGMLYKAVAQTVILYGIKSWVLTVKMLKVLEGFHHRAARRNVGITAWRMEDGEWDHPPVTNFLEGVGIWLVK